MTSKLESIEADASKVIDTGITADFRPTPDITAYELSILLPYLFGHILTEATWQNLGPITRHLVRKNK